MATGGYTAPSPTTRVILWTTARTRSTPFELSMASVPTFKIFHEPYTVAYVFGEDRMYPDPPEVIEPGYSYKEVKKRLEDSYEGKDVVFVKDLAVCAMDKMEHLPRGYQHTFLIRDPRLSIASHYRAHERILGAIKRFDEQLFKDLVTTSLTVFSNVKRTLELYRHVTENLGQEAIVVDSDDLVQSPREVLQRYCDRTGIPFSESMLSWKPGNVNHWPDVLTEGNMIKLCDTAIASSSFSINASSKFEPVDLPQEIQTLVDSCIPLYKQLLKHKI